MTDLGQLPSVLPRAGVDCVRPGEHFPAVYRIRVSVAGRTPWRLPSFVPFCPCGWIGEHRHTKAAALRQSERHVEIMRATITAAAKETLVPQTVSAPTEYAALWTYGPGESYMRPFHLKAGDRVLVGPVELDALRAGAVVTKLATQRGRLAPAGAPVWFPAGCLAEAGLVPAPGDCAPEAVSGCELAEVERPARR